MTFLLSKERTRGLLPLSPLAAVLALLAAGPVPAAPVATAPPLPAADSLRFSSSGVRLPGPQLQYNAAFDLMDFNADGKQDLFMPNTAMMMFYVHLNEGTKSQPRFGHSVFYPLNITETVPQTTEHTQSLTVCDLNDDRLWDMVFFDGQLRYANNTGTPHGPNHWRLYSEKAEGQKKSEYFPGSPAMIRENARYATGPETMFWHRGIFGRQVLTLTAADWDGDGLQDLLISRFKGEAPGVKSVGSRETWTAWGRIAEPPKAAPPAASEPTFQGPLDAAPARGLYFYRNVGIKGKPWFDKGIEITAPDGASIAAPNPAVLDVDGDGIQDLLSTETRYRCNAFRVDWPTAPHVMWFRRPGTDVSRLEAGTALRDADGQPVAAGTMVRAGDMDGNGSSDIVVMDAGHSGSVRVYPNRVNPNTVNPDRNKGGKLALDKPGVLTGSDFLRFDFIVQAQIVNWFGPASRDLLIHGDVDQHCKFALRRTALYRNVATRPGEVKYEFVGWLNYKGDEAMVATTLEQSIYDSYGSAVAVSPFEAGPKQLMMSVGGRVYRFSGLGKDGLSFDQCTPLDLKAEQNLSRGWQELPITVSEPVKYIRVSNDGNGQGNFRDSMLHIVNFEALSAGKNIMTPENVVEMRTKRQSNIYWTKVRRPEKMITPGNTDSETQPNFTSFGYSNGPMTITLKQPAKLEKIRFLLSQYDESFYRFYWPFYWQGQAYRRDMEKGQPWANYVVDVSSDGQKWERVGARMRNEMNRSHPVLLDWDKDGRMDMLLGVQASSGMFPIEKEYRLYRNTGTNQSPKFSAYELLQDDKGKPLRIRADWTLSYTAQCGISVADANGDGKADVFVEGPGAGSVLLYRNVSANAGELKFKADPATLEGGGNLPAGDRHYFDVADVDGDGTLDLLQSTWAQFFVHKGLAPDAPGRAAAVRAASTKRGEAVVSWDRPPGAEGYEIRWGRGVLTELGWAGSTGISGTYDAGVKTGERQTAVLAGLPAGEEITIGIKSVNASKQLSSLSLAEPVSVAPLRTLVLRNGPADGAHVPAYSGTEAANIDSTRPEVVDTSSVLTAQAVSHGKFKEVLIRFKDLPPVKDLEAATLELSAVSGAGVTLAVSCNSVRPEWDAAKVTWNEMSPGKPWEPNELVSGGTFLSTLRTDFRREGRRPLLWDVTAAVREAAANGRNSISLLIRVDYTGKYIDKNGYHFSGIADPNPDLRPRLRLVSRS